MALPEPSESTRSPESGAPATDVPAPEPAPEPYTPERALEWNRYYDRYVAGGLLLLVFLVSAHKITSSASIIWPMLRTGELIARTGAPVTADPFSFTEAGQRWVNIPWVYDVIAHYTYSLGRTLFTADEATGAQIGAGALVALTAMARLLTAWILLRYRRSGPGLWWFALVGLLALGCVYRPREDLFEFELSVGGIARQAIVGPSAWGHLCAALLLLFMDLSYERGKTWALAAIPALFLAWANLDESFLLGLLLLVGGTLGAMLDRPSSPEGRRSPILVVTAVVGSVAICLANPSFYRIFPVALAPYLAIPSVVFGAKTMLPMPDHLAYFGAPSRDFLLTLNSVRDLEFLRMRAAYYLALVAIGLLSFLLDLRRPNLFRLAVFLVAALAWGGLSRLSAEFAIVFTYVVGLNGQDWYQRRYGSLGRITSGWTAWSVGGRAVTILILFLVMAKTLTGFGYTVGRPTFGFGVEPSDFDFDAADQIKTMKIAGRVMNLGEATGDAIIWRAYPQRQTFIDGRHGLFGDAVRRDLADFREAFQPESTDVAVPDIPDKPAVWGPILDRYDVTAVVFSPAEHPDIYAGMAQSKNWIPVRDDGRTVLFGRGDEAVPAPLKTDVAYFRENRLDASDIVYRRKQAVPFPDRAPTAMTFIDRIVRNRSLARRQPHSNAAVRWLASGALESPQQIPDAAHCLMAIREARIALSKNPDDTSAYRILGDAYKFLVNAETNVLSGRAAVTPRDYLNFRSRQRATALNYAIQTTPPPTGADEKRVLADLHYELALVQRTAGQLDLERENLAAARDLVGSENFSPPEIQRLELLDDAIQRFKDDLISYTTETGADGQQRALRALNLGFPGLALQELEEAENQGVSTDRILAMLVDLYCSTGQPEKANERISGRPVNDPALFSGPGTPAYRQGSVNLLLGFYKNAVGYWRDYSLVQSQAAQTNDGLGMGRSILNGMAREVIDTAMGLAGSPIQSGLVDTEANWAAELGFCYLESGEPQEAGKEFSRAIQLNPQIPIRPLLEDYLKKLDQPLPEIEGETSKPEPPNPAEDAKADEPKPNEAKSEKPAEDVKTNEAKPNEAKSDAATPEPGTKPEEDQGPR